MSDRLTMARMAGAKARHDGLTLHDCPYERVSYAEAWEDGWHRHTELIPVAPPAEPSERRAGDEEAERRCARSGGPRSSCPFACLDDTCTHYATGVPRQSARSEAAPSGGSCEHGFPFGGTGCEVCDRPAPSPVRSPARMPTMGEVEGAVRLIIQSFRDASQPSVEVAVEEILRTVWPWWSAATNALVAALTRRSPSVSDEEIEDDLRRLELHLGGEWGTDSRDGFVLVSALRSKLASRLRSEGTND